MGSDAVISSNTAISTAAAIESVEVSAYCVPTDLPEADGTLAWNKTTLVLVEVRAGGQTGIGFTYADTATAVLIRKHLADVVCQRDAMAITSCWDAMQRAIRNLGRPGVASMAISAVDVALWDLKARILGLSLLDLLGAAREEIDVYGSGGFTSYSDEQLARQFSGWTAQGITRVKMKIGSDPSADFCRVSQARKAIGPHVDLFVDANGAYSRKQALAMAERFAELDVRWFEEPVSSDDLDGLHLLRDRAPACMEIAAGEYGYDVFYFRRILAAQAIDVLQVDATRAGGITGFMHAASLCAAFNLPLSAHTAPSIHAPACCAAGPAVHLEYFHDHERIEHLLFDGALVPVGGRLRPDSARPGLGLDLKHADAEHWRVE